MPKISGILFLFAIAASFLEAGQEDGSEQDQFNTQAVLNYNRGYAAGEASAKLFQKSRMEQKPKVK